MKKIEIGTDKLKVIIQGDYRVDYDFELVKFYFDVRYDSGSGISNPCKDIATYNLAKKVMEKTKSKYKDLFQEKDSAYISSKEDVTVGKTRKFDAYIRRLYNFANSIDIPVILILNNKYFLLNELQFINYSEDDEELVSTQIISEIKQEMIKQADEVRNYSGIKPLIAPYIKMVVKPRYNIRNNQINNSNS